MALTQIQNAMTQLLGNSSGALSIDSSGNIGIGNTAQTQAKLLSYPSANQVGLMVYGNGTAGYPAFGFSGQVTSNGGRGAGMYLPDDGVLAWSTVGSERMRIDASGNLGLGVTPSGWSGGFKVSQYLGGFVGGQSSDFMYVGQNGYWDGGSNWKYISNGYSTQYLQNSGQHVWYTAPSGTAGSPFTYSQTMTLTTDSRLQLQHSTLPVFDFYTGNILRASIKGTSSELNLNALTSSPITFSINSSERGRFDSSGNFILKYGGSFVIPDSAGSYSSDGGSWIYNNGQTLTIGMRNTGDGVIAFNTGASERARISTSGNFGIGTTSPDSKLTVAGRIRFGNMYMQGITGYKDNNTSAFDMFDITGLGGHGVLKVFISHHHGGGGQHGTMREFVMALNAYTDVLIPINNEQSFGGGLGFTITRPSNDVVRIRFNGNSVYGSGYFLAATIQSNYAFGISNVGMTTLG